MKKVVNHIKKVLRKYDIVKKNSSRGKQNFLDFLGAKELLTSLGYAKISPQKARLQGV